MITTSLLFAFVVAMVSTAVTCAIEATRCELTIRAMCREQRAAERRWNGFEQDHHVRP